MSKKIELIMMNINFLIIIFLVGAPQGHSFNDQKSEERAILHEEANRHDEFVGFTAWTEERQEYTEGERIFFPELLINEGNHYDTSSSEFTCPYQGLYYISINMQRYGEYDVSARVVKYNPETQEGKSVLNLHSGEEDNPDSTVSNSIMVDCDVDELIYLEGVDGTVDWVNGYNAQPRSTFTVMLLYQQGAENLHNSFNGFSVSKLGIQEYENLDLINFNEVIYSDGNYSALNSSYKCSPGVYFVNYNIRMYGAFSVQVTLEQSGTNMFDVEETTPSNPGHTLTNSGLVQCSDGDELLIRATGNGAASGGPSKLTTFSGFLIGQSALHHTEAIGFSAAKATTQSYSEEDVISFQEEIWDEGDVFDGETFTCPRNGIYFISVNFKRDSTYDLCLDVAKWDTSHVILRSEDGDTNNPSIDISNSGLARCFIGEQIHVKACDIGRVYGNINKHLTTFTAFLMYEY